MSDSDQIYENKSSRCSSMDMKKWIPGAVSALALTVAIISFLFQHRGENRFLREQIDRLTAANHPFPKPAARPGDAPPLSEEQFRELLKLRGEVTLLRRQQDDLLKQLALKTTPAPAPRGTLTAPGLSRFCTARRKRKARRQATSAGNCCVAR